MKNPDLLEFVVQFFFWVEVSRATLSHMALLRARHNSSLSEMKESMEGSSFMLTLDYVENKGTE